jgi:flavin-dependent dehydrogenase
LEFHGLPGFGASAFPTNDGLVMVSIGWSAFDYPDGVHGNLERAYTSALRQIPSLGERVLEGEQVERLAGMASIPNFFRRSAGPGWVLVGDAGYHKDPAAAQGITDAFRDAELLADVVDGVPNDPSSLDSALEGFTRRRDEEVTPWFRWVLQFATFVELSPPRRALFEAIAADQEWADRFSGLNAEMVDPQQFFAM